LVDDRGGVDDKASAKADARKQHGDQHEGRNGRQQKEEHAQPQKCLGKKDGQVRSEPVVNLPPAYPTHGVTEGKNRDGQSGA
jgi:hypothetical protein